MFLVTKVWPFRFRRDHSIILNQLEHTWMGACSPIPMLVLLPKQGQQRLIMRWSDIKSIDNLFNLKSKFFGTPYGNNRLALGWIGDFKTS
jgi:hypothetical protein